jgi:hypothetical protein
VVLFRFSNGKIRHILLVGTKKGDEAVFFKKNYAAIKKISNVNDLSG